MKTPKFSNFKAFISGAARVLDIAGTFDSYSEHQTALQADGCAIARDWRVVGNDIKNAISMYDVQ